MAASEAPVPDSIEGLRAQNRAYRSLCASLEATQAIQTEQGRKYHEAITTLDSEREANARLTEEVDRLRLALEQIAADCPPENPGSAYDSSYGYVSHGNYDDVAFDARQEVRWEHGQIALAALAALPSPDLLHKEEGNG